MNNDFPITCITNQKPPYPPEFICYEDEELKIKARVIFSSKTLVKKIDFNCENKNHSKFEIKHIKFCGNNKSINGGNSYNFRVLLINDGQDNTYRLEGAELGKLDLKLDVNAYFSFNVIASSLINEFKDNCNFNLEKPKSRDGYIIITIK